MSKAQKNFLSGAMILTLSNILVKLIGAVYKIPLASQITPTGMSYYNDAYQIYNLLYVFSSAGLPVAIAKIVSESIVEKRLKEPKKTLKLSTVIFAAIGLLLAAAMVLGVEPLSKLFSNDRTNLCIAYIAPAIFLVTISSTIKGYFQGYKCMTPTAVFQVIEAGCKLAGLGLLLIMRKSGTTDPMVLACGGVLGVSFGSFAASIFMVIRVLTEKELGRNLEGSLPSRSNRILSRSIIALSVPITLSSAVTSIASFLDAIFVKRNLLFYGLETEEMLSVYGAYTAVNSIFTLPQAITVTVGIAALPFLTTAYKTGRTEDAYKNMRSSAKLVALIAMPCSAGMFAMAEPITQLLYKSEYWAVGIPCLRALSVSVFWVSFVALTSVFLQAPGKVNTALINMAIGAGAKVLLNIVAVRYWGIMGAPVGTFVCYGSITVLNIFFIYRYLKFKFPLMNTFVKPMLCSILCGASAFGCWKLLLAIGLSNKAALIPAIGVAVLVYALLVILFRLLSKEDLELVPKGDRLASFMEKKGWIHG